MQNPTGQAKANLQSARKTGKYSQHALQSSMHALFRCQEMQREISACYSCPGILPQDYFASSEYMHDRLAMAVVLIGAENILKSHRVWALSLEPCSCSNNDFVPEACGKQLGGLLSEQEDVIAIAWAKVLVNAKLVGRRR